VKPTILLDAYRRHVTSLSHTRKKTEGLFVGGNLARRDVEQVYHSLYLSAFTQFESSLEELFLGMLCGRIDPMSTVVPRFQVNREIDARRIVFGGKNYVDWLPYDYTEKRAKAFFRNGAPFTIIDKVDRKTLERLLALRNVLAHQSAHAEKTFGEIVLKGIMLTPRERTPAGFLRGAHSVAPPVTRYESLVGEMMTLLERVCSNRPAVRSTP
jgi:hypothetical protein